MKENEARAAQAEREQARLQGEVREAQATGARLAERERAAVAELGARVRELRAENQRLRDRCDELCSALEPANAQRAPGAPAVSWRDEVASEMSAHDKLEVPLLK